MHLRTLLGALLGPLLAWLACEAALRTPAWDALVAAGHPGSPHHARAMLRTHPDAEVAVIGSSVALIDVRPELLERELGQAVVDAGVMGAPLVGTAMLVDDLLASPAHTFVLVVAASDVAEEIPLRRLRAYDPHVALDTLGWSHVLAHREAHLEGLAGWVSLAWRQRGVPRDLWVRWDEPHPRDLERVPAADAIALRLRAKHEQLTWDATSPNARALVGLARRLEADGRELIVVPAPQDPRISGRAVRPELVALLAELASTAPFELVIPARWPVWEIAHFRDAVHLAPAGQEAFTLGLARALERRR
ncbi:MAG: hypothetical protein R3F61_28490 [Myxococcota bacterium]